LFVAVASTVDYLDCVSDSRDVIVNCAAVETSLCTSHLWLRPCSEGSNSCSTDGGDVTGNDQVWMKHQTALLVGTHTVSLDIL